MMRRYRIWASALILSVLSTLTPVPPFPAASAQASEIRLLQGWEVGVYNGTSFHLVTSQLSGYTVHTDSDGNIKIVTTETSANQNISILYSFPIGTVTTEERVAAQNAGRDALVLFRNPKTNAYIWFEYYTDFTFLQWLLGTHRGNNQSCPYNYQVYSDTCWINPYIDISAPLVGSVSDDQLQGGTGPLPSGLADTQIKASPTNAQARLYPASFSFTRMSLSQLAQNAIHQGQHIAPETLEKLRELDEKGTMMEGTLYLNLRLIPPEQPGQRWKIHRWSYTYDLDSTVLSSPTVPERESQANFVLRDDAIQQVVSEGFIRPEYFFVSFAVEELLANDQIPDNVSLDDLQIEPSQDVVFIEHNAGWISVFYRTQRLLANDVFTDKLTYSFKGLDIPPATVTISIQKRPAEDIFVPDRATTSPGKPVVIDVLANDKVPANYHIALHTPQDDRYKYHSWEIIAHSETTFEFVPQAYFYHRSLGSMGGQVIMQVKPPSKGTIAFRDNKIVYTPNPGVSNTTDTFSYLAVVYGVDSWWNIKYLITAGTADVTVEIGPPTEEEEQNDDAAPDPYSKTPDDPHRIPPLPADQIGQFTPIGVCIPNLDPAMFEEDIMRTLPNGDGTYTFVTRTNVGSTSNFRVFVAKEVLEVERGEFRAGNPELSQYLARTRAADRGHAPVRISTDFLAQLTAGGILQSDKLQLLLEQVEDINRALNNASANELLALRNGGLQAQVAFWERQGIYDKYTPKEIEFMNAISFPVAMAANVNALILGSALGEGSFQMSIPSTAKTLSVLTVLENPDAFADIWRRVASGQSVSADELAFVLTDKETVVKAVNSIGLGGNMAETIRTAIRATSGTTHVDKTLQMIADKLDTTPSYNKNEVYNYLAKVSTGWGVPVPQGEVDVEHYKQTMKMINDLVCSGQRPEGVWNIRHLLTQ